MQSVDVDDFSDADIDVDVGIDIDNAVDENVARMHVQW